MSVFLERNHLFLRDPRGGVEDVQAMKQAGFGAVFCNVGDHDPTEWQTIRGRAGAAGVVCGPWLRTTDESNIFQPDRLGYLIDIADSWSSPLIVNSESELKGSAAEWTTYIDAQLGDRDAAISMEAWPFDNVEWWPLADRPVLPQLFLADIGYTPQSVLNIWHQYGIKCVVMTYGAYGGSVAADYPCLSPFGVYTADDMAQQYAAWQPVGTTTPCLEKPPDPEDDMQVIGKNDGVAAEYNRLRDLDPAGTLLVKQGNKWPALDTLANIPLDDWKAWDKAQRRAQILVDDHDQAANA